MDKTTKSNIDDRIYDDFEIGGLVMNDDIEREEETQINKTKLSKIQYTNCPFKAGISIEMQQMGYATCDKENCQLWDQGVYDKYNPGCGMIPRENRRV